MPQKVVLASNNAGKVKELQDMLDELDIDVLPQKAFDIPEIEETGLTFVENAILKARNTAQYSGLAAIADDSGLEVDALLGAPGIYSARYSGEGATDEFNNNKLLDALSNTPEQQRTARFQCVIAFLRHAQDPTPLICQGSWEGRVAFSPKGDNGFGYDPLFYIPELDCHSAELEKQEKNRLSHRGKAVAELKKQLAATLST